jgi:hypothetical protein
MTKKFGILTNPILAPKNMAFDDGALLYCEKRYMARHGRFYDVSQFYERILKANDLKVSIYFVTNASKIDPRCYVSFVALFEK